jgi:type I restriction enzyme S subunit
MPATLSGQLLPNSWKVISVKWLSRRYSGGTPDKNISYYWTDGTIPWLNSGSVNQGVIREPSELITEEGFANSSAKWMPRGSLVMALAGQGKTKAMVGYLDIKTTGNQSLAAIVPTAIDGKFLYWWLTSQYRHIRNLSSQDGRDGLNLEMVGSIRCPVPILETQQRIAAFLDEKTAQIDALIARKQALLARLTEKRQAIITHAVTKGLNPAAPLKDSGIDWLGQIPAHWEVKRLNSFCGFQSGKAHEPFIEPDGDYVCVNARFISTDGATEKRCTENLCPAIPGDILMVMSDLPNGRALARTFLVDDRDAYAVNQRVCRIRLEAGEARYFSYQLNRHPQLMRYDDGNEQTHLPNVAFKQLLLLKPPIAEQIAIADFVDSQRAKLEAMFSKVTLSIAALQEYRAALITSAVTGQIERLQ